MLLPQLKEDSGKSDEPIKEPQVELFLFSKEGQIPTDQDYQVIETDHAWKVFNERVRFSNDDNV